MGIRLRLFLLAGVLVPSSVLASDGRIEINQTSALAGGVTATDTPGFPVTIDARGSYVLTGNLVLPDSNTTAIRVEAPDVSLDLGGFSIVGTASCTDTSGSVVCSGGGSGVGVHAVSGFPFPAPAHGTSVRNGTISGMGNYGVELRERAFVDRLLVQHCAGSAVRVENNSLITDSRVVLAGEGIVAVSGTVSFEGNRIAQTVGQTVVDAIEIGGNSCDDARCTASSRPLFYLTNGFVQGNGVADACEDGFHAGSMHELADPSSLAYDWTRGYNAPQKQQPPHGTDNRWGWIGNGAESSASSTVGIGNCNDWASGVGGDHGNIAGLNVWWTTAITADSPWSLLAYACSSSWRVWCVQD